ncbi:hypothetical protein CDD83_8377 [Cordyceps sp. RAO-2017]|nr:hypothetical protein CDD83_8377 [Cordyceps sp. RAO-2017]
MHRLGALGPPSRLALRPTLRLRGMSPGTIRSYQTRFALRPMELSVSVGEGQNERTRAIFPKIWLRDHCTCPQCVDYTTMQKRQNIFEHPPTVQLQSAEPDDAGITILWTDGHKSRFLWAWLRSQIMGAQKSPILREVPIRSWGKRLWEKYPLPEVPYKDVMHRDEMGMAKGMAELTHQLHVHGFCIVADTPVSPEATKELLEKIGPIRQTHYGGFYDFTADMAKADSAYSNQAIDLHTDTTYFSDPVGLQAFHLLSHEPPPGESLTREELGGETIMSDGFFAARRMWAEDKVKHKVLSQVPISWHCSGNEDVAISPDRAYPVIETAESPEEVVRIRWNESDRGGVPIKFQSAEWYRAARFFNDVLHRPENMFQFRLEPGRVFIFDNWRVLHGRTAFRGNRRICGGYINRDDFVSRWRLSNYSREDVITSNMHAREGFNNSKHSDDLLTPRHRLFIDDRLKRQRLPGVPDDVKHASHALEHVDVESVRTGKIPPYR